MAWVKLDDAFLDHPKFLRVGPLATLLHVAAIAWCNRNLTDGVIPRAQPARLVAWHLVNDELDPEVVGKLDVESPAVAWGCLIQGLLAARLWLEREDGDYEIHDYLDFQPSREQVLSERAAARERKRRSRAKSQEASQDGHGDVTDTSRAGHTPSRTRTPTTPHKPPKGGNRKRDKQLEKDDLRLLAARLYPGQPEASFVVRGALGQGATTVEEIRQWVAKWRPDFNHSTEGAA
jgi:hypothetical protein